MRAGLLASAAALSMTLGLGCSEDSSNPPAANGGAGSDAAVGGVKDAGAFRPAGGGGASGQAGGAGRAGSSAGRAGTGGSAGAAAQAGAPAAGSGGSSGDDIQPGVRWLGRVDASNPDVVEFAWQGAGVSAIVSGSEIAVDLRTDDTDSAFFQAVIDGQTGMRFEVKSGQDRTISLASGLSAGDHRVELYRDTEGMYGVSVFLGFSRGEVKGSRAAPARRIEVVGDSISAGYGNLGSEPHPGWVADPECHWSAANSSWYPTYAARAGRELDADVSTIALSGWGMYRSNAGDSNAVLPEVYAHTLGTAPAPTWAFGSAPAAVVINLGTNDWAMGDPGSGYETAYDAFLTRVRAHYPDAWLFLTIGSMLNEMQLSEVTTRLAAVVAARQSAGDTKVTSFDLGIQDYGEDGSVPTGCDWHPNVADHARMAGLLADQLREKLGW